MQEQSVQMVRGKIVRIPDRILLGDPRTFHSHVTDKLMSGDIKAWYGRWILARELLFVYKGMSSAYSTPHARLVSYHTYMKGRKYHEQQYKQEPKRKGK